MRRRIFSLVPPLLLIFGSCERRDSTIIDPGGIPPHLHSASVSPSIINTDTINIGPERLPGDPIPHKPVARAVLIPGDDRTHHTVTYSVLHLTGTALLAQGALRNDGVLPDSVAGDSVYSGFVEFTLPRSTIGTLSIEITGTDEFDQRSSTIRLPYEITRLNSAPLLSDLQAPEEVLKGAQDQFLLLTVRADDPDGADDIRQVVFHSFRPDGSPSGGNPFRMHDDGSDVIISSPDIRSGDVTRGDGIYSLTIILPATADTGTYRFEFQAFDRSNAGSNVLLHFLTVQE